MDLAGTLSGAVTCIAPGYDAIQRRGESERALERTRNAPAWFCARIGAVRPKPRFWLQDAEIRRLQQSSLGVHAASGQSRDLSPRTGHHAAATARRTAHRDRPDALLSRTRHRSGRLSCEHRSDFELMKAGKLPVLPTVETIRTIAWMKEHTRQARAESRIVGLVPTMGALHAGHLSLVERARRECSPVIASIFVNPKQFGPNEDFSKYPRTFESDSEKLQDGGVDFLFAPEPREIYPEGFATYVNVDGLSDRLEGRSRPGHFCGVTTVVMKLLEIVQPNFAYFGRKDAQQSRLIKQMARDLNVDTEIVVCPPVREADGLALSSRNVYLNAEERKAAIVLYRALEATASELAAGVRDALQLQAVLQRTLGAERRARVDYAEVVDAELFDPVLRVSKPCYVLLAVFIGKTRLIDNLYIEPKSPGSEDLVFHF